MIGIFLNPLSGKGASKQIAEIIQKRLQASNKAHEVFVDQWPSQLDALEEAWVIGGDGTINYFINQYPTISIPIALFKGGTGNDFAWKLYGNISLDEQIQLILNTTPKPVDAGICNGKLFVNSIGIGFDGEVLKSMGMIRWLGGHLGYIGVVIQQIFKYKEERFTIQANQQTFNNKYLLVNIANAPRTGGGFMISPKAEVNDGQLNMMLCPARSILQRLRYLPVIEKGKHLQLPFITHQETTQVSIDTQQEIHGQMDGELIQGKRFDIRILKAQLQFKY